jgi:glycosyltransferase involved in cell wall biosynthesis
MLILPFPGRRFCGGERLANSSRMKILHVSPSFYPARAYGGTIRSSYGLCRGLTQLGCEVRVLTTDTDGIGRNLDVANDHDVAIDGLQVRYCHKLFRHSISLNLLHVVREYVHWADVVHLTAVYSFPTFPTLFSCRLLCKPLVWSPRGSLQRWDQSSRVASKYGWERACHDLALKEKLILHTTSEDEASQSRERFPDMRTVIVPNGVEVPGDVRKADSSGIFRVTYLGRLHPIKGIERLLEACKLLDQSERWHLNIAGSGESGYANSLQVKVAELALEQHVDFIGEVSGEAKESLFANSDVVVAPSYAENFGMVIAEALAHEVPVIAGKGAPWAGLQTNACGLWVDNDSQSLAAAIRSIRIMPLREMGRRGRCWMERDFSWQSVSSQMLAVFAQCLDAAAS